MYDITIVGAGPSGMACAYMASKLGLKTLLVEKNNYLGGQMTGGLVVPVMKSNSGKINTDFYINLVEIAKEYSAQITYSDSNDGWFNPILLKIVLEDILKKIGVNILYETIPQNYISKDNHITNINFSSNILSIPNASKYYVDATGDAKLSQMLSCKFLEDFLPVQPSSLRFIMSGVDLEVFSKQLSEIDNDTDVTNRYVTDNTIHLTTACTWDTDKNWALFPIFQKAIENGDLKANDSAYFQVFTVAGTKDSLAFNCPRLFIDNNDEIFDHSNALIEARKAIYRLSNFMKKYFYGFNNAYISNIADMTGARASKRIKTKYMYTYEDLISGKRFKNEVLQSDYPIDLHSNEKNTSVLNKTQTYALPIESLMSYDYENLFVIGRHIGVDYRALGALRVQKSCMSMGEGLARYIHSLH